ncbi:Ig-like domain-containing protein [Aeromonas enteropelogenes]|uniref:Ig-like domain-containing protein n=1 Tax=Aeromonas enteropelogenes TaxID=29489 RepID=UPI003BA1A69B
MKLIKLLFISLLGVMLTACGGDEGSGLPSQGGGDISDPTIVSLQVTPATSTVPVGFDQQFTAIATLSDNTTKDVTNDSAISWSTDDGAVATIVSGLSNGNGVARGLSPGVATITATGIANGTQLTATAQLRVTNTTVIGLQVSPFNRNVPVGLSRKFKATAFFSDGSSRDVTTAPALTWSSSDTAVATVLEHTGVATGVTQGKTTITASGYANGTSFTASTPLTVTDAVISGLTISPYNRNVPVSMQRPYTAIALLSDGTSLDVTTDPALNWSSSDTNIATIGVHSGIASGITKGSVIITASGNANGQFYSATTPLTVTSATLSNITISPVMSSIMVGDTQQYVATGSFSDGSSDVIYNATWHVTNPMSTYIDASGLATGANAGSTMITANKNGIVSNTATLTVGSSNVVAWGRDDSGGNTTPVQSELHDVIAVYSGLSNNSYGSAFAALRTDGSVVTWGAKIFGGDSSSVQSELHNIISITGTDTAFAALRADGSVITWGNNSAGGDSSAVAAELHNVISISSNMNAFAALRNDGTVVTWGGAGGDSALCTTELHDIQSIVGSISDFAALRNDGTAISWGNHSGGSCKKAFGIMKIIGGTIVSGSSTNNNIFYLRTDGTLIGEDLDSPLNNVKTVETTSTGYAVLHNDGTVTSNLDTAVVQAELYDIESIQGNYYSFAAIRKDGQVITWGDSLYGGDSSLVQSELKNVISLSSTGSSFAALRDDGSVIMWGILDDYSTGVRPIGNVRSITGADLAYAAIKITPR